MCVIIRCIILLFIGLLLGYNFKHIHRKFYWISYSGIKRPAIDYAHLKQQSLPKQSFVSNELHLKYLNEYSTTIDGWVNHEILYVLWLLTQFQYGRLKLDRGAIGEIGVHHGKFTCYLYILRREKQKLFAVDVFEKQHLNTDKSGLGSKKIFLMNAEKYANVTFDQIEIYSGSSLDLNSIFSTPNSNTVQWWMKSVVGENGLQLVSIDGGHTPLLAYSDLCLVANSLIDGGVVIVDDIAHPGWLGVRDGVSRYLSETSKFITNQQLINEMTLYCDKPNFNRSKHIIEETTPPVDHKSHCLRIVPFLQFYNKLFLTTPNYYPYYIKLLSERKYHLNGKRTKYIKYHSLRLTVGNVPVWADNYKLNQTEKNKLFKQLIEPQWYKEIIEN
ncbi:unnamed protein product [Didymodactylos carnosus]|uniref:Uncharacterized protein n=1 Tax=Didymodactylos carnosus TaxID=1234261 RepID=A0A815CY73_9BILA|nr:unnamed protein product [Didymodactylos carnosus]CAF1293980.1 unnamed protein product [Didymodactylos carnosus]CAF3796727.1 unnamed protein product [Didymodactylos carnosus]CAF4105082.1 unnamed protein product [Didymodactylos carnosus]